MYTVLDASMLGIPRSLAELAPLCAARGIAGLSAPAAILDDPRAGAEAAAMMRDLGLQWGLMPMTADFYAWDLGDDAFEAALRALETRACAAEKLGVRWAYNHVWSSSPRPFDENFDWHVRRVARVSRVLADHGIRYGLEFLGPHELQRLQPHPFVHTLAGVLAIADAAGGVAGFAFDTFHWYCGTNGDRDDLLYAVQHAGPPRRPAPQRCGGGRCPRPAARHGAPPAAGDRRHRRQGGLRPLPGGRLCGPLHDRAL